MSDNINDETLHHCRLPYGMAVTKTITLSLLSLLVFKTWAAAPSPSVWDKAGLGSSIYVWVA